MIPRFVRSAPAARLGLKLAAGLSLAAALGSPAQAQVGQSVTPILQSPAFKAAKKGVGDVYTLPGGLVVQLNQRGGLLLSAVVTAPYKPASSGTPDTAAPAGTVAPAGTGAEGAAPVAALMGQLTGYGDGLATPLLNFLSRPDLAPRLSTGLSVGADPFVFGVQTQGRSLRVSVAPQQVAVAQLGAATHVLPARAASGPAVPLRVFSDFQCPYCLQFETQTWPPLRAALPADVRVEFRQFPLESIHPVARPAAEASECAAQQGQFWPYKDALFADRSWLSANPNEVFVALAGRLKLDQDKFKSCLALRGGKAAVDTALAEAERLGLNGTPTVVVGPYRASNAYDVSELLRLVALARAAAGAPAGAVNPPLLPAVVSPAAAPAPAPTPALAPTPAPAPATP